MRVNRWHVVREINALIATRHWIETGVILRGPAWADNLRIKRISWNLYGIRVRHAGFPERWLTMYRQDELIDIVSGETLLYGTDHTESIFFTEEIINVFNPRSQCH